MIIAKTKDKIVQADYGVYKANNNKFKGWHCYSGHDFLWINMNGYVYGNVCKHSGQYGNVYKGFELPTEPIICPAASCYCSSDIGIPKEKTKGIIPTIDHSYNYPVVKDLQDVEAIIDDKKFGPDATFQINWNLGRRCNYDCSYCPSTVHDNFSPHLSLERFKIAFDNLYKQIQQPKIKFTFTGGEPTINPDYIEMVEYAVSHQGVSVFTNTNGTASVKKLKRLAEVGGLYLSVHEEFTVLPKLVKKLEKLKGLNIYVKMMMPLTFDKEYTDIIDTLLSYGLKVNAEPLVDKADDNKLYPYNEQQLHYIRNGQW